MRPAVATAANCVEARSGNVMRMVASRAAQLTSALQETLRCAQPIGCVCDLEVLVLACGAIERQPEVPERLAGHIGKRSTAESLDGMRQPPARRFEMALE